MTRHDGRRPDELRPVDAIPDFLEQPHGCVLWSQGKTRVLCTATIDEDIPRWLRGKGRGWMTAEYSLLPASTGDRTQRGVTRGRPDGRTVEIQRLIGRALRAVCDFEALGERTLWLDCDVLQADGGTRCAAITGAYVAAYRALDRMGLSKALPGSVAAVSVGVVDGVAVLDLDYPEDSEAETDMNVVMTADGRLVEVQATAEREPFTRDELDELLELAARGIDELAAAQREAALAPARVKKARLASGNPHKLVELRRALPGWELELVDDRDFPPEDGSTYEENARVKALHGRGSAPPDTWAIGEDSGIEAAGLGGRPGIASARWADDGVARMLDELDGVADRAARYVCVIVAIGPAGEEAVARGTLEGGIAADRSGDEGFGYDPIFVPDGEEQTVAELGNDWKARHSHRARAAARLAELLGDLAPR